MIGTTLGGRYQVREEIGVGSMGVVYRAQDARLRRDVALKVIAPHLMRQNSARDDFVREAETLAALTHPNIVTIHDVDQESDTGIVFIVMELLEGELLRRVMDNPSRPPLLPLAIQLSRALESAHARNILHRDLKPDNIFVCPGGFIKLLDFGLARLLASHSAAQSETVVGTLNYMAPEQMRGLPLDGRADLYALGVICYEYVAGRLPFSDDNPATAILRRLTEPPIPLRAYVPGVDAEIEALIMRLLESDPHARIESARQLGVLLEATNARSQAHIASGAPSARSPAMTAAPASTAHGSADNAGSTDSLTAPFTVAVVRQHESPAPAARRKVRHNLPEEDRPFVGRQQELADVLRCFREHRARVVTIAGLGGVGKTRLAKQAAVELLDDFPDGVWLVELEALCDRSEIVPAICNVLGIDVSGSLPDATLRSALATTRMLLVLDCFEALKPNADILDDLVKFTQGICCLVTSRMPLGIPREFAYSLEPMTVAVKSATGSWQPGDSVSLFVDSATHVKPDFRLTPENQATILEACELLDGIPLSIVLASAWIRYLSLPELLEQIRTDRLGILTADTDSVLGSRHADIRKVIEASFSKLPPDSMRLLHRLGTFVGGFYIEDAQRICGESSALRMTKTIARLSEHSVVQKEVGGDRTRYRILDTVRECLVMASQLNPDIADDLVECSRRHAERYAVVARHWVERSRQRHGSEGTTLLWRDIGNLRAAIAFSIGNGNHSLIAEFADTLGRFFFEAGMWSDFELLADAAATSLKHLDRQDMLARLLGLTGAFSLRRGQREDAERLWKRKLALAEQLEDTASCVDSLCDLAQLAQQAERFGTAKRLLGKAIRMARQRKRGDLLARPLGLQAETALAVADVPRAIECAEQARSHLVADADRETVIDINLILGRVYRESGSYSEAEAALLEMLRIAGDGRRVFDISRALLELGGLYERQRALLPAARAYSAAERVHSDLPSQRREAARAESMRFQAEFGTPELRDFVEGLNALSWQDIVSLIITSPVNSITRS